MKMGTFLTLRTCRYGVFALLYIVLSWAFVEVFVEMQQKMNRDRKSGFKFYGLVFVFNTGMKHDSLKTKKKC